VRLAALNLREISRVYLEGGWFWDSGIPCFHLNSRVSYFLLECHLFCVNSVEFSHFSDTSEKTMDSMVCLGSTREVISDT